MSIAPHMTKTVCTLLTRSFTGLSYVVETGRAQSPDVAYRHYHNEKRVIREIMPWGSVMAEPIPIRPHPVRLGARLETARAQRFVGRVAQLELFRSAISDAEPPFSVLFFHGPGGVGKTSLLDAFARVGGLQGVAVIRLDGRSIEPSPAGFLRALRGALGLPEHLDPLERLNRHEPAVLLLDTYEQLAPLDAWLRERLLPELPAHVLTVIAGRNPPAPAWRTDPGWNALIRVVPLRNLDPAESEAYLRVRGVPEQQHAGVLASTHGHPLALSLVADLLAQGDGEKTAPRIENPDIIRVLLDRFVQGVPDASHRRALHICAHARVTIEGLLAEVLETDQAGGLFEWLRELSFIERGPDGLFPHDLARDVLENDLRWRNPERYREDHRRIRNVIVGALQAVQGIAQQRAFFDLLFLHRHNPLMQPFVEWATLGAAWAEPAAPEDHPVVIEMIRRHEGAESAAISRFWLDRQPEAFTVFRTAGDHVIGCIATLTLPEITPEFCDVDPAMSAARAFIERFGPLRPGEIVLHHRFALGRDSYQVASPVWNMVIMSSTVHWLTTPRLAWSFIPTADPEYWRPTLSYVNIRRSSEADFTIGGHMYGVFAHDWRSEPPLAWLDLMAERELDTGMTVRDVEVPPPAPLLVLAEPLFREAVRQALRDVTRPDRLAANPLLRSALVRAGAGDSDDVTALQALLREAAATLRTNPKDLRFYRAAERGYFAPAATQELAAESLDLPFSTYRSHLATATQRIAEWLWQRELETTNQTGG